MGDLRPLGSEKLQGMDKISRILEIAKYRENIPNSINENSKNEYSIQFADGQEYQIIKEKAGYIIKRTISESETEYIEPMKNRKYYGSYSQALKRLNLMIKENNTLVENKEGISLFSEQKKFVLKTPEKKMPEPSTDVENVPAPPPAPAPAPPTGDLPTPPAEGGEEPPMPDMGPEGDETSDSSEMPNDIGTDVDSQEDDGGQVTFKTIQKLVGKLGQKLRALESQGDEPMSSKDMKYVINSVLSALNLSNMDADDIEEITSKFDDIEGQEGGEDMGDEEDMGSEDTEGSPEGEEETAPEGGEMGESWADLGHEIAGKTMMKGMTPGVSGEQVEGMGHYNKIRGIADEMFAESKVEDILSRYFIVTENEKKYNKKLNSIKEVFKKEQKRNIAKEIKRLSETVSQEVTSRKFLSENTTAKFIGKTNKRNLVFEIGNKQFKISPEGNLI